MPGLRALRNRFVDAPDSLGERFRAARWERFRSCFPGIADMRVIDLGGTADNWLRSPLRPKHVHLVNLEAHPAELPDWISAEIADVTAPEIPDRLGSFDLVVSNSTIEHVGGPSQRRRFVTAIEKLAPLHWVQTPTATSRSSRTSSPPASSSCRSPPRPSWSGTGRSPTAVPATRRRPWTPSSTSSCSPAPRCATSSPAP
ncbi:hypothetical protein AB6O49_03675 [Streptomyces sp. SBR177]